MKVETPQLRWHQIVNPTCQKDAGANGPILSCSLLTITDSTGVLATAGNTEVNLWLVRFMVDDVRKNRQTTCRIRGGGSKRLGGGGGGGGDILVQPQTKNNAATTVAALSSSPNANADRAAMVDEETVDDRPRPNPPHATHTGIEHIVTLSRGTNERAINAVKFSPSGRYLVAAGDSGTVVSYALPNNDNDNDTAVHHLDYWTTVEKETDLSMRMLFNQSDDVMDISWSADSKRFVVCSLDHTLTVWEYHHLNASGSSGGGGGGGGSSDDGNNWRSVHRSNKDHTHYIQGVAYDPKGVYMASMGSDRMVKVYIRKEVSERAITAELAKYDIYDTIENGCAIEEEEEGTRERRDIDKAAIRESKVLPGLLTNSTFVLQSKIKTIKFLNANGKPTVKEAMASVGCSVMNEKDKDTAKASIANAPKRHHIFVDELTLGSFFRRLSFTTDGVFLVVPAALWHGGPRSNRKSDESSNCNAGGEIVEPPSPTSVSMANDESSFATYLFARHQFDQPYKVLTGLDKPSVVIRPNPILFKLPSSSTNNALPKKAKSALALPYRSIFAVLTNDSVVIYDTHHDRPLALARGLHYAGLTDAAWSSDGRTLFVTSSDGYISILSFVSGELGEVYVAPTTVNVVERKAGGSVVVGDVSKFIPATVEGSTQLINMDVPNEKEVKMEEHAVTTTNSVAGGITKKKVRFDDPLDDRSNPPDPDQPVINNLIPKKKLKKIVPIVNEINVEKKRQAEVLVTHIDESQRTTVKMLVAKKKTKVVDSSTTITTM